MKSFGFTLLSLLIIVALIIGGYFAVTSLKSPASYVDAKTEKIGDLRQVVTDTGPRAIPEGTETPAPEPVVTTPPPADTSSDLQTNIQKLADAQTVLKIGAKGASVGYIQEFMNLYFKKTAKVDGDFGKTTETNVKTFQGQNKITQTGQVGPQTLKAMVAWLEKNT